jgi:hypothetical protein
VLVLPVLTQQHTATCQAAFPLVPRIPQETGARVGVSVEAVCDVPANRTYLVLEKGTIQESPIIWHTKAWEQRFWPPLLLPVD